MTMHFSTQTPDISDCSYPRELKTAAPVGRKGFYRNVVKQVMDITLTLLAAPFVVLLVSFLAVLVSLDGKSPFYSQMRVGRNGRLFRMWKLRTMVHDADARLESYLKANPQAQLEWDNSQKLKNDPRVTRVGRALRKTSMDELPQLLNVLGGTMSLVGPRPMMPKQQALYSGQAYFALKPGITGLWQISDRNHCEFSDRVHYDDHYDRNVSLKTDVSILVHTIGVVVRGTGY